MSGTYDILHPQALRMQDALSKLGAGVVSAELITVSEESSGMPVVHLYVSERSLFVGSGTGLVPRLSSSTEITRSTKGDRQGRSPALGRMIHGGHSC
jgi:hypothetical protein